MFDNNTQRPVSGGVILATLAYTTTSLTVMAGSQVAQLILLSRDLKNTEQSTAVWGTPGQLQAIRHQIVAEHQYIFQGGERHE